MSKARKEKKLPSGWTEKRVRALLRRAKAGDETCREEVRALLREAPAEVLDRFGGNIVRILKSRMARILGKTDIGAQFGVLRSMERVEADLAGPNPTPLERLLAGRVAIMWFQANFADAGYWAGVESEVSIRTLEFFTHQQESSHRRFLAAGKALAVVQRLAMPALKAEAEESAPPVLLPASLAARNGTLPHNGHRNGVNGHARTGRG